MGCNLRAVSRVVNPHQFWELEFTPRKSDELHTPEQGHMPWTRGEILRRLKGTEFAAFLACAIGARFGV